MKEKIEILDGSRGRGTSAQAAVRRSDLAPLMRLPHHLTSRIISSAPTKDDYNALRKDVKMLHEILVELSVIQQGKRGA